MVEELGEADLELEDEEVVAIACPSVFGGEGLWQHCQPAPEKSLDMGGNEPVADILHASVVSRN